MTGLVGVFSLAALSMLSTSTRIFSTTGSKMDFISSLGKRRLVSYNLTLCAQPRVWHSAYRPALKLTRTE